MKKITTLLLAILMVLPLMAATPEKLYFKPSNDWKQANARFAAYFFGNGSDTWVSMKKNADVDGMYEVDVPAGYPKVIFCRMNPSTSTNNWDNNNKWNQSGDLTIPTNGNNLLTMPNQWDGFTGTWSKYTPPTPTVPTLSNFKADPAEVEPGKTVTFSCKIDNPTNANIIYTVDGKTLDGNTWTATEEVGAHIATANYEGATPQQLIVTVVGEPTVQEGQNIVFFDNTESGWDTVYAYAWEGASGLIAAWPGTPCEYIGNNIWQYECGNELPGKIVFNNGGNGQQTGDLAYSNHGLYNNKGLVKTILPAGADIIELAVPAVAYTGFEEVLNVSYNESLYEGYTLSFTINDVEQSEATWTPAADGTYTIVAVLTKGGTVKTSEPAVVTVKSPVALYLLKEEGKELNYIYYWTPGGCPAFPGVKMNETFIYGEYYYYYAIKNDNADFNFSNGSGTQTVDISATNGAHYYRLGAMDGGKYKVEVLPTPEPYAETIVAGYYYLEPTVWAVDNAWYAVYLYNRNKVTDNYQWVQGYVTESGLVVFTYGGEEKYTHMIFCRMNPAFLDEEFVGEMQWNKGDEAGASDQHVWNQTEGIEYGEKPAFSVCIINGWNEDSYEWSVLENATGIEGVEATNGIAYANGIVAAEGAIEVYNVNGMVVARGNESLDLRNLNAGVYIVRNGNNVRKVVR